MTNFNPLSSTTMRRFLGHIISAGAVVHDSPLSRTIEELVNIRASQINGCGACLDMHVKDAAVAGESSLRLALIAAWRETTVFTDAERAALELTEFATRLADSRGIPDDVWAEAARHFDDEQLGALVAQISLINAFNRLNVTTKQKGGSYDPAHYAQAVAAATSSAA